MSPKRHVGHNGYRRRPGPLLEQQRRIRPHPKSRWDITPEQHEAAKAESRRNKTHGQGGAQQAYRWDDYEDHLP